MKSNMGTLDRVIRIALAALFAVLIATGVVVGTGAWILGVLGAVFLVTAVVAFCPLYLPFGISTRGKK
ncbi:MAG TPA: DUF2892 domain-containing protein [Spirochaetales bacterium]|nr:DUF2892 domain-containing protein [Spirochaetales bacterium]